MSVVYALTRDDVAKYVAALFYVYMILIFVRILLSWIPQIFGPLPYSQVLRSVLDFVHQVTDPYLNIFRRILPPLRFGGAGLDLSPMLGIFLLIVVSRIVVSAIQG